MKRILVLILLLATFAFGFTNVYPNFRQGLSLRMTDSGSSPPDIHRLFIDGSSGNYLLIDGANHYLKIDGA